MTAGATEEVVGAVHFVSCGDALSVIASGFELPMRLLGELRIQAIQAGAPYAAVYIEGARGALRHALESVLGDAAPMSGTLAFPSAGTPFALGIGDLAVVCSGGPLAVRGRLSQAGSRFEFLEEPDAELDAQAPEPELGEDLLADGRVRHLCQGPAFAALLAVAIGHHRWIHSTTGRMSSLDPAAARAVVSMLSGGRPLHGWPYAMSAGLLDAEVSRELARLGWRRLVSPTPARDRN
jgi:hypothetical protein